ncbi:restriction endonuclease subunit S [Microcystis aeruginosa]|uniref:restriction endonuclease subunit S n=1 Tax=Microcystis aeruginosa TaxID=1126 RepID=UPI00292E037D|nr:restriction endonuclease subunit S [Microcystis aeruginosa]WOB69800.1 restriction endonuclease subunit S [Microcystis aeruginosa LE3]
MKKSIVFPILPLGKICILHSGGTPRRSNNKYYGGNIPWAKIADLDTENGIVVDTEEYITVEGLQAINNRIFPKGSILLAMYGSIGKLAIAGRDISCNQAILGIQIKDKEHLDINYLRLWLTSIKATLEFQGRGVTQQNISKSIVEKLEIPLPPLEEQRRIAAILDKADGVRRKRKEAIRLTEELLRSTFLEMFGDPVTNPKGWEVSPFGSLGKLDRGKSKHRPRNDPSLLGGKYPLIQTGDVANSKGVIKKYTQTYSDKGLAQSRMWPAGTLCITIAANIAQTGILTFDSCFPDSIVGFKPNNRVTTEYIQAWLGFLQPRLEDLAPQSAQKNINLQMLRELDVPVPPVDLQSKFSEFVKRIGNNSRNYEKSEAVIDNLFNSLLQRAFRGEL